MQSDDLIPMWPFAQRDSAHVAEELSLEAGLPFSSVSSP